MGAGSGHHLPVRLVTVVLGLVAVGFFAGSPESRTRPHMNDGRSSRVLHALNERGRSLKGSRVLVLGIAYKKNMDDLRESPALGIIETLIARGADVAYGDPHLPIIPRTRRHHIALASIELTPAALEAFDAVLLVTDHDTFDYGLVRRHARLLVDTRGR